MKFMRILLSFFIVALSAVFALATDYPAKSVKVIISFSAGSATDFVGRTVSEKLSETWKKPVVAENHPGTAGALVAKAGADGYTLLMDSSGYVIRPSLKANLPYDPLKAFIDIAPLARQPLALIVGTSSRFNNVSDLLAAAKAEPGKIKFGSPGIGGAAHLATEEFNSKAGIDTKHVPFKGGPETIKATNSGAVQYSFLPVSLAVKGVKNGKLRILGITSAKRNNALPDVPTIAESGFPGFESYVWWGMWAPVGTPPEIVDKLAKDIGSVLADPDVLSNFKKRLFEPMVMSPEEFAGFVRSEMKKVEQIVKEAGMKPE